MRIESGNLVVKASELPAALQVMGLEPRGLSPLPQEAPEPGQRTAVNNFLSSLSKPLRSLYSGLLDTLADPVMVTRLQYSLADEKVSRQTIAWSPQAPDTMAVMINSGRHFHIAARGPDELFVLLSQVLANDGSLFSAGLALTVSSEALLVFLAVVDYLRLVRLQSMLRHSKPYQTFTASDLAAMLTEAGAEDFRWALLFLDKILPVPIAEMDLEGNLPANLKELEEKELIIRLEETGDLEFYELSEVGEMVADGLWHEVSKAALGVTTKRSDGALGHEVVFLARSSFNLFLFDLAGREGVIATLGSADLENILGQVLAPPPATITHHEEVIAEQEADEDRTVQRAGKQFCSQCGQPTQEEDRFCSSCGATLIAQE